MKLPRPILCVVAVLAIGILPATAAAHGETRGAHVAKAKKAKRGPRGPRGAAGAPGATGATGERGERGEKGERGERGERGEKGDRGEQGDRGEPGPLLEVLPAGRTLRGTYVAGASISASGHVYGPISFPVPLATTPVLNVVQFGSGSTVACPGTVAEPQATAGNFCLYVRSSLNVLTLEVCSPVANACPAISRFGGLVDLRGELAGNTYSFGTWAVTAP